ncbi:amidohydrolase 2 [Rhodocollybia butyracea]|uniref:Amidohydrolase 2 n=1 Tax=Rhodocollybia butyracea TaxID=206335 RepID=A0A9P5TY84_9AGAR|nr:amidohydrolase 2 [Rhodocollybia butyracea]
MNRPFQLLLLLIHFCVSIYARVWNDTGTGTIVLEEAWTIPELMGLISYVSFPSHSIMVLSCASPCIQGISDPATAGAMAVHVNNVLADRISNSTHRFGAFAALSMHNASEAAAELKRAVEELGFFGVLVNDYQQSGENNDTLIFYDQPEFDVFWQMVTDLDVPVYFHPRINVNPIETLLYGHAPWLIGPAQEFAATLSSHIIGLCTNGVFDRFPKLKIIVGHLGERIPSDFDRIDTQLLKQLPLGMPMLLNVTTYFHRNLYETTSGNFATSLLQFHKETLGLDRILYSIDYPFVEIPSGTVWVNGLDEVLTREELSFLKRGAAIKLLKLND